MTVRTILTILLVATAATAAEAGERSPKRHSPYKAATPPRQAAAEQRAKESRREAYRELATFDAPTERWDELRAQNEQRQAAAKQPKKRPRHPAPGALNSLRVARPRSASAR